MAEQKSSPSSTFPHTGVARAAPTAPGSSAVSSVQVLGFVLKSQESENYIVYHIEIASPQLTWRVDRRFREIESLSKWIHQNFPQLKLPSLPSKVSGFYDLLKSREEIAANRVKLLDQFLKQVFQHPLILTCWEVQQFFGFQTHLYGDTPMPDDLTEGILYINVLEAKHLSSSATKFYVKTLDVSGLDEQKKVDHVQTKTSQGSRDPMWYEEQALTIHDSRRPVRFQVWEAHSVRSDQLLGHIQLDMRPMTQFLLYDIWLPLVSANGDPVSSSECPQLRVLAQFTPMKIHSEIKMKLPSLRLQMHKKEYYAGEVVRGQVVLNSSQSFADALVAVCLLCIQHTSWSESYSESYTDSDGNTQTRTASRSHGASRILTREERILYDQLVQSGTPYAAIAPGFFVWPFEFQIPARISPTFTTSNGAIAFRVEAGIYRSKKHKQIQDARANLKVSAPFAAPLPEAATPHFEPLTRVSGDENVIIEALLDSPAYILGEERTVIFKIQNNSQKTTLKDGKISLRARVEHNEGSISTETSFTIPISIVLDAALFPIGPGESRDVTVLFQLPLNIPPSTVQDLSPLIDIKWFIHTSFSTGGIFSTRVRADRAVVVSQPALYDIPAPKLYPTEQPENEDLIKEYGFGLPQFPSEVFSTIVAAAASLPTPN